MFFPATIGRDETSEAPSGWYLRRGERRHLENLEMIFAKRRRGKLLLSTSEGERRT